MIVKTDCETDGALHSSSVYSLTMAGRGPAETGPRLPTAATPEPAEPEPRASQCQDQRQPGGGVTRRFHTQLSPRARTNKDLNKDTRDLINPMYNEWFKLNSDSSSMKQDAKL